VTPRKHKAPRDVRRSYLSATNATLDTKIEHFNYGRRGAVAKIASVDEQSDEIIALARELIVSGDMAPNYPVLREIIGLRRWDEEQALWFLWLFLTYHHIPSALTAVRLLGDRVVSVERVLELAEPLNALPVTIPRRLFSGKIASYMIGIVEHVDPEAPIGWSTFIRRGVTLSNRFDPEGNYRKFFKRWRTFSGHRERAAAMEMARLMRYVQDWPIRAPSIMMPSRKNRQPGLSLRRLYNTPTTSASVLGRMAWYFRKMLSESLIHLDWEIVDIFIPKADAYTRGRYYVGYEIDELLSQMNRLPNFHPEDRELVLTARANSFNARYLGEKNDWNGVRREMFPNRSFHPRILRAPEHAASHREPALAV